MGMEVKEKVGWQRFSFLVLICSPAANNHPAGVTVNMSSTLAGFLCHDAVSCTFRSAKVNPLVA
jgi:hypothetical protein